MDGALEGIAQADARLGVPFPLPAGTVPLCRWVDVRAAGERGAEVIWSLDDTRPGAPARLALYAGPDPPPDRDVPGLGDPQDVLVGARPARLRSAPLPEAQPSLRPVTEVTWHDGVLHCRLTGQGPWAPAALLAIAASVPPTSRAAPV